VATKFKIGHMTVNTPISETVHYPEANTSYGQNMQSLALAIPEMF